MTIEFNTSAVSSIFTKYQIVKTQVSKAFGQTSNATVDRWIKGNDIYSIALTKLCSMYNIDILSFFTHDGHAFNTTTHDIAVMEEAGLNLRDLLLEKGVKPAKKSNIRTLVENLNDGSTPERSTDKPQAKQEEQAEIMSAAILDRFVAIQTSAFSHEQQSLERQRRDMQAIIDRQDAIIAELKRDLKKCRANGCHQVRYALDGSTRTIVVNDDTELDYQSNNNEDEK